MKDCVSIIAPYVTDIINTSITTWCFQSAGKHAIITPLIKKYGLDDSAQSNNRPLSNFPFLSKILEPVINRHTIVYLDERNHLSEVQSASRRGHSTETSQLRIFSDLIKAMDTESLSRLSLLDLSDAFDTVAHDIQQMRLKKSFSISRRSFQWFVSYLTDRTQSVFIAADCMLPRTLKTGVPQGSVLGPLLFTIYTAGISKVIRAHVLLHHSYAWQR